MTYMLHWTMSSITSKEATVLLLSVNTTFLFESVAMDLFKTTFFIFCNDNASSPNFVWSVILNTGFL